MQTIDPTSSNNNKSSKSALDSDNIEKRDTVNRQIGV
jgi:hypothetical protein